MRRAVQLMSLLCRVLLVAAASAALVPLPAGAASAEWANAEGAATTQPGAATDLGPDVVVLRELVNLYDPVPFEHRAHAEMAEMWDGCVTCHHESKDEGGRMKDEPEGAPSTLPSSSSSQPSPLPCKSCHPVSEQDQAVNIHMPSLKGAYHRQCLNCHKEWSGENDCVVCHLPRNGGHGGGDALATAAPAPGDIVGRMHPPIPEPDVKVYRTRYTPAVGPNAIFRHEEHVNRFGFKCVACHRRDNCGDCHSPQAEQGAPAAAVLKPAKSWSESHGPCMSCHEGNRCGHCHYHANESAPKSFDHAGTGQALDADHAGLKCFDCHAGMKFSGDPTCGDASCHENTPSLAFPADRPGPIVPEPGAIVQAPDEPAPPSTQPARAVIRRVRR